jgi:hypothetical protein
MSFFCRKGDLLRLNTSLLSGWQGIGIAAEDVYADDDPDTVVAFYKQDQPDAAPSMALIGDVELVRPTNRQIDRLFWQCEQNPQEYRELIRKFLARWGRPAIEPVPIAERLPGPEDCDAHGWCWLYSRTEACWDLRPASEFRAYHDWLPHHALPVPQQEAE